MTTNKKLLLVIVICLLAAGGIYAYAYTVQKKTPSTSEEAQTHAQSKVAASSIADGTYTVQIRSITMTPEDTAIRFVPVTYFEGTEASTSASHDVPCKDKNIVECVPTLAFGYYVRPSTAPDFTAPLTQLTQITLMDNPHATERDLTTFKRDFEPVFDVLVQNGNVSSIIERTPLPKTSK